MFDCMNLLRYAPECPAAGIESIAVLSGGSGIGKEVGKLESVGEGGGVGGRDFGAFKAVVGP